jgi:hypothetical protein
MVYTLEQVDLDSSSEEEKKPIEFEEEKNEKPKVGGGV